jgi:hypothetical protein
MAQTADERAEIIIRTSHEIGAPPALMLAIANVESGDDLYANDTDGHIGTFQLSNGYGGCFGVDRYDVAKSTRCTWSQLKRFKPEFTKTFGDNAWQDWMYYMLHQQGSAGWREIWENRNGKINTLSTARAKNIRGNVPNGILNDYVFSFIDYWQNRIEKLVAHYTARYGLNTVFANASAASWIYKIFRMANPLSDLLAFLKIDIS